MADDADDLKKRAAEIGDAVSNADDRRAADQRLSDTLGRLADVIGTMTERLDKLEAGAGKDDAADDMHVPDLVAADRDDRDNRNALGLAQAKADEVAQYRGERAPPPLTGENLQAYRRRLLRDFKADSAEFRAVDLWAVPPGPAFDAIEARIFADAKAAADKPFVPVGELRAVTRRVNGHDVTEFYGEPRAWMDQFSGYKGSVKAFRPPGE